MVIFVFCRSNKNESGVFKGCGKSTIVSLLLRFYDIEQGVITIDGKEIKKLNLNWLRSKIGLVSQEPVLFNTTIFENICYGDVSPRKAFNLNDIIEVSTQSNIHSKIDSLPEVMLSLLNKFLRLNLSFY
jgi:ATP-binding cassette subfamily B (MDR/TAP) protein 1